MERHWAGVSFQQNDSAIGELKGVFFGTDGLGIRIKREKIGLLLMLVGDFGKEKGIIQLTN